MSVDYYAALIKGPEDALWDDMMTVLRACRKANVVPPEEVSHYFNLEDPDESWGDPGDTGIKIDSVGIEYYSDGDRPWATDIDHKHNQGIEIDLSKLPLGVTSIQVYCSA